MIRALLLASLAFAIAGCSQPAPAESSPLNASETPAVSQSTETPTETSATGETASKDAAEEQKQPSPPTGDTPKAGEEVAVMETSQGKIVLRFFWDKAPGHVENFQKLAKKGFYDGTRFHRVIPGFMIQGGDPNSKSTDKSNHGTGGPGYSINAEFNDVKHVRGILSMARSQDPNSAGSQFYIVVADSSHLDGNYTAFGKVVTGLDTVDKIVNLDRDSQDNPNDLKANLIKSVKIVKWPIK